MSKFLGTTQKNFLSFWKGPAKCSWKISSGTGQESQQDILKRKETSSIVKKYMQLIMG